MPRTASFAPLWPGAAGPIEPASFAQYFRNTARLDYLAAMAAERPDPYRGIIEDFDREVERVLSESTGKSLAPVRDAVSDFDDWWRAEVPGTGEHEADSPETIQTNKELEISRSEARMLREEIARLKSDPEKSSAAELKEKISSLERERERMLQDREETLSRLEFANDELRARGADLQRELADNQIKFSRDRDAYDGRVRQLEERSSRLEEQLRDARECRQFVEAEMSRQRARLEETESCLRESQKEKDRLQENIHELARKLDATRKRLADKDSETSALESTIAELRNQATELRERLIKSSAVIDEDRRHSRRRIGEIAVRGEELEARLSAEAKESEAKIRETTRYLEMKIREIHDENKEQFVRFRELLDALVRFRGESR